MSAVGSSFHGSKGGCLFTSQDMLWFRLEGISLVINLNATSPVDVMGPAWNAVQAANWASMPDLFPSFGMPSF